MVGDAGMNLIAALSELCSQTERPIIAIDGPAGAGKTTFAQGLSAALSKEFSVQVFHMDDLYNGWDLALGEDLTSTLKDLTRSHLAGLPYVYRKFDWGKAKFNSLEEAESAQVLILEGVGSGQRAIRDSLTALVWIDIAPQDGLQRVLIRDGQEISPQMNKWLGAQSEHFAANSTQEESEFVLTT